MFASRLTQFVSSAAFRLKRSTGMLERQSPGASWTSIAPAANASAEFALKWKNKSPSLPIAILDRTFLAPHLEQFAVALGHSPEAEAKAIASGRFRLTSGVFVNLGAAPEWNRGQADHVQLHWSKIPAQADLASVAVGEVSQFNWAYPLVRAWILSGDDAHVETFWNLLENWMEKNPPNLGPQWVSDEAIARRILAVTFAVQAFRFHPTTTDQRLIQAARFIAVSAERLRPTFSHVQTQSITSGLRSALALFTAGALWPNLPAADSWRSAGLESLIIEGKKLCRHDGYASPSEISAYAQILEIYTWAEIILRVENERESLPESLQVNIRALAMKVGQAPAIIRPFTPLFSLSGCASGDVRPAVATALILFTGVYFEAGPWDESTLLLVGPMCTSAVAL